MKTLINTLYSMNLIINERIAALRTHIAQENIQAFIIPSTDPHLSEYVAPHWQSREWISGFTGSAGTVVITAEEAGLWTDSRYFLQAARQIEGTEITLYKEMLPETPSIPAFLNSRLQEGDTVGIDGKMFSAKEVEHLQEALRKSGIHVKSVADPLQLLWKDRPAMPLSPAFIHDTQYAGRSFTEKLAAVRKEMDANGAESLLLSALDEIAWLLNIRGNDVHCNPVVVSYLLIEKNAVHYFIQPQKVTAELTAYFNVNGISVHTYEEIEDYLNHLPARSILADSAKTNYAIYSAINPQCRIIDGTSPVTLLKAIRNKQEIAGIHTAMQRDGVALVKFLKWLKEAVPAGNESELSVDRKLYELRAEQANFKGISFDTIAGYKEHAAIVHYEATPETDIPLKPEGMLLLDSGAQYPDGTTDITRTIVLGPLSDEEKTDYTLVLKGFLQLQNAVFPEGTCGTQLDVLARQAMWKAGINYFHGTGHGVGHFLCVHEGPHQIRMNHMPTTLRPGMTVTNEPGIYKAGRHGIRTENTLLIVPAMESEFGSFMKFEPLTLCPIDKEAIVTDMLTDEEINWFNEYHKMVYSRLSPQLNKEEQEWLKEKTSPLKR